MKSVNIGIIGILLLAVAGCSTMQGKHDQTRNWAAQRFYTEGQDALKAENYHQAIEYFLELQRRYPKDKHLPQAQLETAYAWYKIGDADEAVAAANRYIDDFKDAPYIDYAYYLKGLARYQQGLEGAQASVDDNAPANSLREAFRHFAGLTRHYPNSKYTEDALKRMVDIRNKLAEYEISRARNDLARGEVEEAAKRAEYIVEHYEHSPTTPDAYQVMVDAYTAMGLNDLAADARLVLLQKYPDYVVKQTESGVSSKITPDTKAAKAAPLPQTIVISGSEVTRSPESRNENKPAPPAHPAKQPGPANKAAPSPAVIATTTPVTAADGALRREQWLLAQNPGHYTLQLIAVSDEKALLGFIDRHRLQNQAAYFDSKRDGHDWYALVYGSYPTREAARRAVDDLPAVLRRSAPWIRRFGDIQSTIQASPGASGSR